MPYASRIRTVAALLAVLLIARAHAEVALPQVIGNDMVLQRNQPVPIWGTAAPDEQVKVSFAGQEKAATADANGKWVIKLDAMPASADPRAMTIAASNTIELNNILVGEVWLCGGQSNMEFNIKPRSPGFPTTPQLQAAQESADNPQIRLFLVAKNDRAFATDGWKVCTPETVAPFSAVGYFFGREIQENVKVPVGLIESCWGGSHIERWTPAEAYENSPAFASQATSKPVRIDNQRAGQYFEPMVRPLIPFAMRGMIWYQGESNIINSNDGMRYVDKFKVMIDSWRSMWAQGDFPVYAVQIVPYYYTRRNDSLKHDEQELPRLWEAQLACTKLPNVGLAQTIDLADSFSNIHPSNKWDVGHRLALIAQAKLYGAKDVAYSGPIFKSADFADGKVVVHYDFTGTALKPMLATRDGAVPNEFTIAGEDGNFVKADAKIDGATVIVSSPEVSDPKAVRFAWHETAQPNLIDASSKLPAYPFRTGE